jgi:hypothetical protein
MVVLLTTEIYKTEFYKMLGIEYSLRRLKNNVSRFAVPSVVIQNVLVLEEQIEFRKQALRDIETIRRRLRPFVHRESKSSHARRRKRLR